MKLDLKTGMEYFQMQGELGRPPRLAFVQDALPFWGGAERVLSQVLQVFPGTPVYTLVYNPAPFQGTSIGRTVVHPSFIDHLPGAHHNHRIFLPLYPLAVESLDLSAYDLVISFSYAAAHGVLTRPDQTHLALFHTPLRQAYHQHKQFVKDGPRSWVVKWLLHRFRIWDYVAAARPDYLFAISAWAAELVWQAYRRPAEVIYPPVEVERFHPSACRGNYYICVSRLEAHKRLDIIVRAFNRLGLPLLLVGDGRERKRLQKMAHANIHFLGRQTDASVSKLLSRARGFVHAAAEDFGIALVEAQAAGCPVIAYQLGGASETVIPERTGILFPEQNVDSLIAAILSFESTLGRFSLEDLRASAERFSVRRFRSRFAEAVTTAWYERQLSKSSHGHYAIHPESKLFIPG
jgi:glycosyltransferase involved in cell wall biosynthesis